MGKARNLTEEWKARLEQKRKERAAQVVSVPVVFAGFEGRAHRLNLIEWAMGGRLPQYLSTAFFEAVQGKMVERRRDSLTPEEQTAWLGFQCEAFCSMMDEPRFSVDASAGDGAIFYPQFAVEFPEVVNEAVQWQLNGCPNIPVQTESGETDVDSLKKFRRRRKRPTSSQSGFNRAGMWWDTKPTARVI
jgi:hypothetical protein